ncbi:MAG TPA: hypothetical protein PKA95_07550, partial [Thermomicrobiales bacterium]|nr:hypothetical protein [Thermomicrobiales bacterium]
MVSSIRYVTASGGQPAVASVPVDASESLITGECHIAPAIINTLAAMSAHAINHIWETVWRCGVISVCIDAASSRPWDIGYAPILRLMDCLAQVMMLMRQCLFMSWLHAVAGSVEHRG